MKALQILKEVSLNNKWLEENGFFFSDRKIKEAIKELEELENRTCINCNNFKIFNSIVVRDSCSILNVSDIGGCGDYFEPKKG